MAGLAVLYVAIDPLAEAGWLGGSAALLDIAITGIFLFEFVVRFWAAPDRRKYLFGHLLDLIALLPTTRPLRIVRLLRLVRLLRSVPVVYKATGLDLPVVRRLGWHARRVGSHLDRRILSTLLLVILLLIGSIALVVTLTEKDWTLAAFGESLYWAANTVLGSGDPSYVTSPFGWILNWLLILLGLTVLAVTTGVLVGLIVDIALKEGRGMGAAGYRGHTIVCGWNSSARELVAELANDEYGTKVALLCPLDENPAGAQVHFVSGDPTNVADLERAGLREAQCALIFPDDATDLADMRSILVVLAIESTAPQVRTIVEVNNPQHVDHFHRAGADEVIVPSQLAAHLAARSALYPGLTDLVADIVSGGEGAELYRIQIPEKYVGLTVDELATRLLREHRATLMAIGRGSGSLVNPPHDEVIQPGDDALVVAQSVTSLRPLQLDTATRPAN
jgi:voltage-gated potassium channel